MHHRHLIKIEHRYGMKLAQRAIEISINNRKLEKTSERSNRILIDRHVIEYYAEPMQTIRTPRQPQNEQRTITTPL